MLNLHFWPTPNGKKVTIFLEEAGVEYRIIPCDIVARGDQFAPSFLALNPNHRMPVLVDDEPADGAAPISVFESGAILCYLAEKTGRFWPQDLRGRYQVLQWTFWQMANQGPKSGELGHFLRLAGQQGDQSYALRRFGNEVHRLYGVLNRRLYDHRYLGGDEYSIADMICYPWTAGWRNQQQNIEEFRYFKHWFEELSARPGIQKGMAAGANLAKSLAELSPEERDRRRALLNDQRALPVPDTGGIER